MIRLVTGDDVCTAAQRVMVQRLPVLLKAAADERPEQFGGLVVPESWRQVPRLSALSTSQYPAGAVTSPGLTDQPQRRGGIPGSYDATWRVVIGVVDRVTGGDVGQPDQVYDEASRRARAWAALIRAAALSDPSLGGIGHSLVWATEEYAEYPDRSAARTLSGCAVAFDITVRNVADLDGLDLSTTTPDPTRVVLTTHHDITVNPSE